MKNGIVIKYERGIRRMEARLQKLKRAFSILAFLRFTAFLLMPALPALLIQLKAAPFSTGAIMLLAFPGLACFTAFFFLHMRIRDRMQMAENRIEQSAECLVRLSPDWAERLPPGDAPAEAISREDLIDHAYAPDLNLFGRFSLFQYLDRTSMPAGRRRLATALLSAPDPEATDVQTAAARADAVNELKRLSVFRARFRAAGRRLRRESFDFDDRAPAEALGRIRISFANRFLVWPARILPIFTFASIVLFYQELLPAYFMLTLPVQCLLLLWSHFQAGSIAKLLPGAADYLEGVARLFRACSTAAPRSPYLKRTAPFSENPHREFERLARIAGLFALRKNPISHLALGVFVSYEIHLMRALEDWLDRNVSSLGRRLDDLAALDALMCLGEFAADHPECVRPELLEPSDEGAGALIAVENLAHPLLPPDVRVPNSFRFDLSGALWLISGSNMSGKSTFLRSVGVNLLLAMLGAPVCAKRFAYVPVRIRTAINQTDDLRRSISLFYGEVRRIRMILDSARDDGPPLFYLIDEMLRGTNARERRIACRSILAQLTELGARGMVTTHDLELLDLCGRDIVVCRHFEEIIAGGKMSFDYTLKEGPVKSSNALKILELEGIRADASW